MPEPAHPAFLAQVSGASPTGSQRNEDRDRIGGSRGVRMAEPGTMRPPTQPAQLRGHDASLRRSRSEAPDQRDAIGERVARLTDKQVRRRGAAEIDGVVEVFPIQEVSGEHVHPKMLVFVTGPRVKEHE